MPHVCRECKRTFATELKLELHRDRCESDLLLCERCGERFPEARATSDGWRFSCPNGDCTGEGIEEDLRRVSEIGVRQ